MRSDPTLFRKEDWKNVKDRQELRQYTGRMLAWFVFDFEGLFL